MSFAGPFVRARAPRSLVRSTAFAAALLAGTALTALPAHAIPFNVGDLVVSIYGNGDGSGGTTGYGDNAAAPIVLQEVTTSGGYVGSLVLPQTSSGRNSAISGEYGSSSEGTLTRSADGHSLVIAGYGVNANTYNTGGAAVYGNAALAQSTSIQGGPYTAVSRVIADIDAHGQVDTSTALYNIDNTNNPRSVATVDGKSFYVSGQGGGGKEKPALTQGVWYATDGASSATAIDTKTDTRTVEIYNGHLYTSLDTKQNRTGGSTVGTAGLYDYGGLPTSATTPTALAGTTTGATSAGLSLTQAQGNYLFTGPKSVFLSPENFFFANATTLYVADSGNPKEDAGYNTNPTGASDGGLQKWTFANGTWSLQYTLSLGLNLVPDTAGYGTTGLIGLAGQVSADGSTVSLYATNATVGDLDPTYLYGITDQLGATTNAGQSFTTLLTAAPNTNIRGVAFAPVPEPGTMALLGAGVLGLVARRRRA